MKKLEKCKFIAIAKLMYTLIQLALLITPDVKNTEFF